jgi:hypothetical protein
MTKKRREQLCKAGENRMKKWLGMAITLIWLTVGASRCHAATPPEAVTLIGDLIKAGRYELAQQQIGWYLGDDPNNVDILMMQGNLILNERLARTAAAHTLINESIYQKTNGYCQPAPLLIPQSVARVVAEPWRKCLELDPDRADIREGLAYLYAQAVMTPELLALLPDLQAGAAQSDETQSFCCTLAGMLAERNALAGALKVYRALIKLYPDQAAVYAELAATLLQHGELAQAQQALWQGAALPGSASKQLYWTAFKFEATVGNYQQALGALQALAKLTHKRDWQFYQGLLLYYQDKPQWSRELRAFLAAASDLTDKHNRELASFLLSRANRHDYASYQKSLAFKVDAAFLLLLHRRAMVRFPDAAEPVINYAEFLNIHHNYAATLHILAPWEARPLKNPDLTTRLQLQLAWALQNTPEPIKANPYWLKLFNVKDFFIRSAAIYFYGKNLLAAGDRMEAARFFKIMAPEAAQSKYAFYCARLLQQLEQETEASPAPTAAATLPQLIHL